MTASEELHHYRRPDMSAFVVTDPVKLQHERGSTLVHGKFVTPELARELQAAHQELEEAMRRAGMGPNEDPGSLPAWDDYFEVILKVGAERRTSLGRDFNLDNGETLDVPTSWLFENMQVDPNERLVTHQVITPGQLAVSKAVVFSATHP